MKRDCECPRANHQHGSLGAYQIDGCRCFPCRLTKYNARVAYETGGRWLEQPTVDSIGTMRRLQALTARGWSNTDIGKHLGICPAAVTALRVDRRPQKLATAQRVADLYDRLWDKPPPGRYAVRVARQAAARGWVPPLAWDCDDIDNPAAKPQTGAGFGGWELQPCGTAAAAMRHRRAGEPLDEACRLAANRERTDGARRRRRAA